MPLWFTLVLLAATFLASELLRPKPRQEKQRPAGLGDFRFPTASLGRPVPLVWGTVLLDGANVCWYGNLRQKAIKKGVKSGLFSHSSVVTGFRYYVGIQFALCRGGAGVTLKRVLVAEKEVFSGSQATEGAIVINKPSLFGGDDLGSGGLIGTLRWYTGGPAQTASAYLTPFQGGSLVPPAAQPKYVGTCQAVWERGYVGNSPNIEPWAFEVERVPNGLALSGGGRVNTKDANPLNVAYELFTDLEWGFGFAAADIDVAGWAAAGEVLVTEGNGFSMVLDSATDGVDLLAEVERQVNGIFFLDHQTGKWRVKLIRADYAPVSAVEVNAGNLLDVRGYSRAAWQETTNQVRVEFVNRDLAYRDDQAPAQDPANFQVQGGASPTTGVDVSTTIRYPGVKDRALANQLAWRDLRTLSFPLSKATLTVDRTFFDLRPGDVIAWTDVARGLSRLLMRVQRIDYGEIREGRIILDVVQDVFYFMAGSFADPPDTRWTAPLSEQPAAFPVAQQVAFESPRAFVFRDPLFTAEVSKVWASGRLQDAEVDFEITYRHAVGAPAGAFTSGGKVFGFMLIGRLKAALSSTTTIPTASILIEANPDVQADLEEAFEDGVDAADLGILLKNLILVGDPAGVGYEFMLVTSAAVSGADVDLQGVYRGVLDGGRPSIHAALEPVYLLFVGGGLIDSSIPETDQVHVRLLPETRAAQLTSGSANQIAFTMARRNRRPYCPGRMSVNGTVFPATASLDANSGSDELRALRVDWLRRDYRTAEGRDEVAAVLADAATLFSDFPAANNHTTRVDVYWHLLVGIDVYGPPVLLFTEDDLAGTTRDVLRIKVLRYTDGVVPGQMTLGLAGKHDQGGLSGLLSRGTLLHVFLTTSANLAGKFNFGARIKDVVSNTLGAFAIGTYPCTLSSAFVIGAVEFRENAGAWQTAIAAGATTGNVVMAAGGTLELRHRSTDANALKQFNLQVAGGGAVTSYFICYT